MIFKRPSSLKSFDISKYMLKIDCGLGGRGSLVSTKIGKLAVVNLNQFV